MSAVKSGLKMFVRCESINHWYGHITETIDTYTGKTGSVLCSFILTNAWVIKNLCSTLLKNSTNPSSGYHIDMYG